MGRRRANTHDLPAWAAALADARRRRFRSQEEFGKAIGYSQQRVADWEAGNARPPPDQAARIAKALGLPATLLLPPGVAAALEQQQPLHPPGRIDELVGELVAAVCAAMCDAGAKPSVKQAVVLALRMWRLCGGSLDQPAAPEALAAQVDNLRGLWADLANLPRNSD